MSNNDTISATLQILFGITGIFSVIVGLFDLHHRDSLVFVLYRRLKTRQARSYPPEDGLISSDISLDDQSPPVQTWTDQSHLSSNTSSAAPSLSETTSNDSNTHPSSCSTVVGTELAELPGYQL